MERFTAPQVSNISPAPSTNTSLHQAGGPPDRHPASSQDLLVDRVPSETELDASPQLLSMHSGAPTHDFLAMRLPLTNQLDGSAILATPSDSLAGSAPPSPRQDHHVDDMHSAMVNLEHQSKKQKMAPPSLPSHPARLASNLSSTLFHPPPIGVNVSQMNQLSSYRQHAMRMAGKALHDVRSLIGFVAATEPHLLAGNELTSAMQLISNFVAALRRSHTATSSPTIPPAQDSSNFPLLAQLTSHHQPPTLIRSPPPPTPNVTRAPAIIQPSVPLPSNAQLSDFELGDILGVGTYGVVRLSRFRPTGRHYCVKMLNKEHIFRRDIIHRVRDEKNLLLTCDHPFILRLYCTLKDRTFVYLMMEYANGGDLHTAIQRYGRLKDPDAKFYAAEVLLALSYLHQRDIAHRDVKPENILLDREGHVKLADFGFAKVIRDRTYSQVGTPEYLAFEVYRLTENKEQGYDKSVDWWAFGVLIYEMLTGRSPFAPDTEHTCEFKVKNTRPSYPWYFDASTRDLIHQLTEPDFEHARLGHLNGAGDIKSHPWFQSVNWNAILQKQVPGPICIQVDSEADTRYFAKPSKINNEHNLLYTGNEELFSDF